MSKLIKRAFLIVIILLGAGYYFYANISDWRTSDDMQLREDVGQREVVEQTIITPPPLRGPVVETPSYLTASGTVAETNTRREEGGLPALVVNEKLNKSAQMKVDDMFDKQYFAHESPAGEGPGDLASAVGYEYLMVGENLALGNYENDAILVDAWMNSPGHRENIMHAKYTEIGVAVRRGVYEGRTVWLAVQEFGRPASLCPSPSASLAAQIDINQNVLADLEKQLSTQRAQLDAIRPKRGVEYNEKVKDYNELVDRYNVLIEETKVIISEYNRQADAYNVCAQ